jgi:hypothetical protein
MRNYTYRNIFLLLILISGLCCRQTYIPPNIGGNNTYLVVDGIIIDGQDSTIINLSRSQNISDSSYTIHPETGAKLSVVGANGDTYNLSEQSSGRYVIDQLNLNINELYKLKIITSNGNQYLSDSMLVKLTPPIDSISFQLENDGAHVYANTHDPQNNTRYYRWQYIETWEYHSAHPSEFIYHPQDTTVIERDTNQMVSTCWQTDQSTNLLLGSSANLANDIIYEQPIILIPSGSQKLSVEYSIFVKQYALNADAYNFWQLLQQNTEQLGTLFDAQPSQLTGNIHHVANPNEPVLGYISISTIQQQRIFIIRPQGWNYPIPVGCNLITVGNTIDSLALEYGVNGYAPVTEIFSPATGTVTAYSSSIITCVDCTLQGGTTAKPSFWPN